MKWIWLFLLSAMPITLWILPVDYFDDGSSLCPSQIFLGLECYGCGSVRAFMHLHHLDFGGAWKYNKGIVLYYPFIALIWSAYMMAALRKTGIIKTSFWSTRAGRRINIFLPNRP